MTLKDEIAADVYFGTLLDLSVPEHRKFLSDFKHRTQPKGTKNNNKNKANTNKSNAAPVLRPQNGQNGKAKESKVPDKGRNNQNHNNGQTKSNVKTAAVKEPPSTSTGAKKKTKYVSLYGEDGKMNDIITLKGRHLCNCEASKHKLINNCMQCGRVVCEQEGSGPCLFCGNLVCTEDELRTIESSSQSGDSLKKALMKQERPKGWEEALAMRNRLLDYDRTSEKRTTVIDDESDYFRANSVWLSDEERAKLKKIEDRMREKKHASRLEQKVTIDFTGRQVIEEPTGGTEFDDEVLKEIANAFHSNQGYYSADQKTHINFDNYEDCDPNLTVAPPIVSIESRVMGFFLTKRLISFFSSG